MDRSPHDHRSDEKPGKRRSSAGIHVEDRGEAEYECVVCHTPLRENDRLITWRPCHFCGRPVCFNCIHYFGYGHTATGGSQISVFGVCDECMPHETR